MEERVVNLSGAKLRKSKDERDAALSKICGLKGDLKTSNDAVEKLTEGLISLQSKLDRRTNQRGDALGKVGGLKADLKGSANEGLDLTAEYARQEYGPTRRCIEQSCAVGGPSIAEPPNKKRKIGDIETRSMSLKRRNIQESWVASVENLATNVKDLKETLSAFIFSDVPKRIHSSMLGYLFTLFCAFDNCINFDPEGKGLNWAKRLSNLQRYRENVDAEFHLTE